MPCSPAVAESNDCSIMGGWGSTIRSFRGASWNGGCPAAGRLPTARKPPTQPTTKPSQTLSQPGRPVRARPRRRPRPGRRRLARLDRRRPAYQPSPYHPTMYQPRRPDRGSGRLRRAARPLVLLLPGRGVRPGAAGRGGGRPRPAGAGADRPRRHVRGGPVRRGRRGARAAHRVRRRAEPRHPAADHPGRTLGRGPGRHPRPARLPPAGAGPQPGRVRQPVPGDQPGPAARRRQGPAGLRRSTSWPNCPTTTGWSSPAAARAGPAGARSTGRARRGPARRRWRAGRAVRPRTTSPSSSPTRSTRWPTSATPRWPSWPTSTRLPLVATTNAHYAAPRRAPAGHRDGRGPGPHQPGRAGRLAAGLVRPAPALRRRDGGPVAPLPGRGRAPPPGSATNWPSRSG